MTSAPVLGTPDAIDDFRLEAYDFEYPTEFIAKCPAEPRDSSRLLILDRKSGDLAHRHFRDLPQYLKAGDCVVINRTKVWPARLVGRKSTGGKAELLLVREIEPGRWTALASGLRPGMRIHLAEDSTLDIESLNDEGEYVCRFSSADVLGLMSRIGMAPLPPYILKSRKLQPRGVPTNIVAGPSCGSPESMDRSADLDRYQTVYARDAGSIAAPTAGLHFTPELLGRLKAQGVRIAEIVLHVGRGTFKPVTAEDVREHRMLPEWYHVPTQALSAIQSTRQNGGRIVTVGTTATRTLETLAKRGELGSAPRIKHENLDEDLGDSSTLAPKSPGDGFTGWTDLYIGPDHRFEAVNALITNFHLPRSSPLILAGAFAGRECLLAAYREAIVRGYRLYSYGDAMLIL